MRPSLPPNMGDNAAAQATLEARLRREQVKRVAQVEDLSNVVGNAADGQVLTYSQAKGAWQPAAGGGQRYSTFVVATSNPSNPSLHHLATDADLIVTGTNDDVAIQTLIYTQATGSGFDLVLLDGTFNFGSASVNLEGSVAPASPAPGNIRGVGSQGTFINSSTAGSVLQDFQRVSDLSIHTSNASGIAANQAGIVDGCVINGAGNGIVLTSGGGGALAIGNEVKCSGYGITPQSYSRVIGNWLAVGGTGVDLSGFQQVVVADNRLDLCLIGVLMSSTSADNSVHGNLLTGCGDATHDAIVVSGSYNNVQNNTIRRKGVTARYGISVVAASTGALVTNNDLHDAASTATFNDAGTGTITTAGNRL